MAAIGFAGRYVLKQIPNASTRFTEVIKNLPKFDTESLANSKYYKGGFEPKMTKREASLILGVSPTANKAKVCIYPNTFSHFKLLKDCRNTPFILLLTDQRCPQKNNVA